MQKRVHAHPNDTSVHIDFDARCAVFRSAAGKPRGTHQTAKPSIVAPDRADLSRSFHLDGPHQAAFQAAKLFHERFVVAPDRPFDPGDLAAHGTGGLGGGGGAGDRGPPDPVSEHPPRPPEPAAGAGDTLVPPEYTLTGSRARSGPRPSNAPTTLPQRGRSFDSGRCVGPLHGSQGLLLAFVHGSTDRDRRTLRSGASSLPVSG